MADRLLKRHNNGCR